MIAKRWIRRRRALALAVVIVVGPAAGLAPAAGAARSAAPLTAAGAVPAAAGAVSAAAGAVTKGYILDRHRERVSAFDPVTNTITAEVVPGVLPVAMAIRPGGAELFVANVVDFSLDPSVMSTVSVISTATDSVVATIPVDKRPTEIVFSPDGRRAYVNNSRVEGVTVIDAATRRVSAVVPLDHLSFQPNSLAISPDGARLYVAMARLLVVIDTATNTVIDTIDLPSSQLVTRVTPNGAFAYLTDRVFLTIVDLRSGTIVASIRFPGQNPTDVSFTPDGRRAYVSMECGTAAVVVIDTTSRRVTAAIPVGRNPNESVMTPDGRRLYVVLQGDGMVSAIDTATNTVVDTFGNSAAAERWPYDIAVSDQLPAPGAGQRITQPAPVVDVCSPGPF